MDSAWESRESLLSGEDGFFGIEEDFAGARGYGDMECGFFFVGEDASYEHRRFPGNDGIKRD